MVQDRIESRILSIERYHCQCVNDLERPQTQISMSGHSLTLNICEMARYF